MSCPTRFSHTVLTALLLLNTSFIAFASPQHHKKHHVARADCSYIAVESGNGCGELATRCGISGNTFMDYNPGLDCSTLAVDQWVCCSSGTLPSKTPNENPDGSCYTVDIIEGSDCHQFSVQYDVDIDDIEEWNEQTWRWTGCSGLQPGMKICMSSGTPPLPDEDPNIPCGLESVGNKECPLNACCGKWGYCGLTDEFCETNPGGAPGTGCQSNCEKISSFDNVGKSASTYGRNVIGYYSNWSAHRSCNGVPNSVLPAVRPSDLDPFAFTHLIYSFCGISRDTWMLTETQSDDGDLIEELQALKQQNPNLKTMWAVGGWAFNDPPTQDIFSLMARTKANRETFVTNVLSQLQSYGFDGIDIDWEYPGVERGGIEADRDNFLELMKEFKAQIAASGRKVELSFTAPASFWYLQQFPIKEVQKYTDWINLMTYDIHGSWDIKFGIGVLPHTAIPEVNTAVNMFLKAGVSLNKINLGIGFYGRSFTLADPSCNVGGCPMSGGGLPGPCTDGEGFLSYGEIEHIIQSRGIQPTYNSTSQTMTLKYDNQWVGYDNPATIAKKLQYVLDRRMPGVLIWAVDLDKNNALLRAVVGNSRLPPPPTEEDCPANGSWPRTKPGKTASIPCPGAGRNVQAP
ncbi:hypothetical protein ONZ45_g2971 [Pleurotus djamor]|nr:hypothetical protein ONZ45_g2971 [Pleurotus djamor]